jgi:hypothetical protein
MSFTDEENCPDLTWTSSYLSENECKTHNIEVAGADYNNNPRVLRINTLTEDTNTINYLYLEPYHAEEYSLE